MQTTLSLVRRQTFQFHARVFTILLLVCLVSCKTRSKGNGSGNGSGLSHELRPSDKDYISKFKPVYNKADNLWVYYRVAYQSFLYLNKFRAYPSEMASKIDLDLGDVQAARQLVWDPILAKAATQKAIDMATHNYFSHVDPDGKGMNYYVSQAGYRLPGSWVEDPKKNYIESIAASSEFPDKFIDQLIVDKNVHDKGHRNHLLALTSFYKKATRCGIGIIYDPMSKYHYYCCVLIAPAFTKQSLSKWE